MSLSAGATRSGRGYRSSEYRIAIDRVFTLRKAMSSLSAAECSNSTGKEPVDLFMKGHIPIRTCLVCARKDAKSRMVRLSLDGQTGIVAPDPRQRMKGRGGYACPGCMQKLRFDKRVQRAFRGAARELLLN